MEDKTILLVEDNEELNEINRRALVLKGYSVLSAKTLGEAREYLSDYSPDVILLDVMLPDGDGIDFCKEIRDKTDAHILFLTSRVEHEDRVRGLETGGDDYITKPYHPEEMISRVAAAIRRREMSKTTPKDYAIGSLTLDIVAGMAYVNGNNLRLSTKEFALLYLLSQNEGKTLTSEYLYETVWKLFLNNDVRPLRTQISELRRKMANANCEYTINAVYGKGYCFERI